MAKVTKEALFDPRIIPANTAGKSKDGDRRAIDKVLAVFKKYRNHRIYTQGGKQVNLINRWDELYRVYKTIRDEADHSYKGEAKVFMPIARKAINVIETATAGALFSREDYFSVSASGKENSEKRGMAAKAFKVLKHYSDNEGYPTQYKLAIKQGLIYGATAVESIFSKDEYDQMYRKLKIEPVKDPASGEQLLMQAAPGAEPVPLENKSIQFIKEHVVIERPRIEARDIYRLYLDSTALDPSEEDMIYRDAISANRLLKLANQGVYNKAAVLDAIKTSPAYYNYKDVEDNASDGSGKTFIEESTEDSTFDKASQKYEVLRFQGLFSDKDPKTGMEEHSQYWIDILERKYVLRIMTSPTIRQKKTFSVVNYDNMINEFYTDGVIDPIKCMNYEINDKENQSLDGLSFNLNAPWLRSKKSQIKVSDILRARKKADTVIDTHEMDGLRKLVSAIPLDHINIELMRLTNLSDVTTGATGLTAGQPTKTQADRSGKALDLLMSKAVSQFAEFIRSFESRLMQPSMQKIWDMLVLFCNDQVEISFSDDGDEPLYLTQSVNEICGMLNIRVSGGSQFVKEREIRDAILEFMAILGTNDLFMKSIDPVAMISDIAAASPYDMKKYVNPDNLYAQQQQMIEKLVAMLQQYGGTVGTLDKEIQRLRGEIKQTDRSNAAVPAPDQVAMEAIQGG